MKQYVFNRFFLHDTAHSGWPLPGKTWKRNIKPGKPGKFVKNDENLEKNCKFQ